MQARKKERSPSLAFLPQKRERERKLLHKRKQRLCQKAKIKLVLEKVSSAFTSGRENEKDTLLLPSSAGLARHPSPVTLSLSLSLLYLFRVEFILGRVNMGVIARERFFEWGTR